MTPSNGSLLSGETDKALDAVPKRRWLDVCVKSASQFQHAWVGIDLTFDQVTAAPFILQTNAFGDFSARSIESNGKAIYQSQIENLW